MIDMAKSNAANAPITDAEVALSAGERAAVRNRAIRPAIDLGVIGTLCWYVFWIVTPNSISVWAGLLAFPISIAVGYCFARLMLRRQVNEILVRRQNLLRLSRQLRNQSNTLNQKEN
jgi:hypothetical protein